MRLRNKFYYLFETEWNYEQYWGNIWWAKTLKRTAWRVTYFLRKALKYSLPSFLQTIIKSQFVHTTNQITELIQSLVVTTGFVAATSLPWLSKSTCWFYLWTILKMTTMIQWKMKQNLETAWMVNLSFNFQSFRFKLEN